MAKRKKTSLGCLFWVAFALFVVVVFLYNRETINRVVRESGIMELLGRGDRPQAPPADAAPQPVRQAPPPASPAPEPEIVIKLRPGEPRVSTPADAPVESTPTEPQPISAKPNLRRARLFFVIVDAAGNIQLRGVVRSVAYLDSPLRETLGALLEGQESSEISAGLLTMIPKEVRLRNVYVKSGTAYVDLSDDFRFNNLGQVGLDAQVRQVVYTATEFSSVARVQILIEGKNIDYLSSEGPYIGKPLSREELIQSTS